MIFQWRGLQYSQRKTPKLWRRENLGPLVHILDSVNKSFNHNPWCPSLSLRSRFSLLHILWFFLWLYCNPRHWKIIMWLFGVEINETVGEYLLTRILKHLKMNAANWNIYQIIFNYLENIYFQQNLPSSNKFILIF